jgi:hypothetical protein
VALSVPATLGSSPFDLPWTLSGGRGLFGLDPVRGALLFWAALMAFTLLFVLLSALLTRWQWSRLNRAEARAADADTAMLVLTPIERARLRAEAGDLIRQAAATAAAAKRAQSTVEEACATREAAQQAREAAWTAFDAAQRAYEEALREASALSAKEATRDIEPAALADAGEAEDDDKRELSRAALAAFKRGDISVEDLGAVFRQASGWDPVRELQAREVELRRTAESRARRLYQAAAAAERSAVKAADVATVAAQALAEEAVEVAAEAREVREELNAALRAQQLQRNVTKKIPRQRQRNRQVSRA